MDVTDVCGVRIITYFADDVDRVAAIVEEEFEVDTANSVDKRALLDPDRFGYLSLHYVVTLRDARAELLEYRQFAELKAEIQIRSILQHAWAEVEHDLGYKTVLGIPREIRRQFSSLAGLLEIADREFAGIRDELAVYEREVGNGITSAPDGVLLDKASLSAFVKLSDDVAKADKQVGKQLQVSVLPMDPGFVDFISGGLQLAGVTSIGQLQTMLSDRMVTLMQFGKRWWESSVAWHEPTKSVGGGISLLYLFLMLLGEKHDARAAESVLDQLWPNDPDNADTAVEITEIMSALGGSSGGVTSA